MLSLYAVRTTNNGTPVILNTVTKQSVPADASELELHDAFLLQGQELDAIHLALARNYESLSLTIIPSWECNLRCKHCSVLTLLKERQVEQLDPLKILEFSRQYIQKYAPKSIAIDFVGGEPLLRAKTCVDIINTLKTSCGVDFKSAMTTNGSIEFSDECWQLFDLLSEINVSIDGDEVQHNSQRIPFKMANFNPYRSTMQNLQEMADRGYAHKIKIKAALKDEYLTKDNAREFYRKLVRMGISVNNIVYGCHHPTDHTDTGKLSKFKTGFAARLVSRPCCKYRSNVYLIEANGDIYDVPFKWARTKLGTIDDGFDKIVAVQRDLITNNFICFNDPKCMKCPVIGYCWGGCVTADPLHNGTPSDYCHQADLQTKVAIAAEKGVLISKPKTSLPVINATT